MESAVAVKECWKDKKMRKKLSKVLKKAQSNLEIDVSETATQHLMITNMGIVTGAKTEDILNLLLPFGPVKVIMMVPGQTFSFITLDDVNHAACAYNALHGKAIDGSKKAYYLVFVNKMPDVNGHIDHLIDELPPGLSLINDFISVEKEEELLQLITWNADEENSLKHRQVRHFGYKFCYDSNNVDVTKPLHEKIPDVCLQLLTNLYEDKQISHIPDQLTVNRYLPGQGIPLHVDTHSAFEDEIISLSIGSPVVMEFKHYDGRHLNVLLPSRSLLIMSKESRYAWKHGISPRKSDLHVSQHGGFTSSVFHRGTRISFTFRKVKLDPCQCQFSTYCDSQTGISSAPKSRDSTTFVSTEEPAKLENSHVHQVYEKIADHFSSTRYKPWPKIADFLDALPCGSLMLDIGCGNGKYLGINPNIFKIGCDRSSKLVSICRERGFETFCNDALILPVRSGCFDVCICIAVIHHLSTAERRLQALQEMGRILKCNGKALIYVWSVDQKVDGGDSNYIKHRNSATNDQPNTEIDQTSLPVHTNRSTFQHQDLFVPWKLKAGKSNEFVTSIEHEQTQTYYRYYHMFEKGELEKLCESVEDFKIVESYYDKGNWCVVLEKINA
ncbi:Alkylated DNA repair protein alkB 8 [Chamberlinius hualienensis]